MFDGFSLLKAIQSLQIVVMAFQSGTAPVQCYDCEKQDKFFKLCQSYRPQHAWTDSETNRTKATLFCLKCELKMRKEEWSAWSAEEKEEMGEDYATMKRVKTRTQGNYEEIMVREK